MRARRPDEGGSDIDPLLSTVSFLVSSHRLPLDADVTTEQLRQTHPELSTLDNVAMLAATWAVLRTDGRRESPGREV